MRYGLTLIPLRHLKHRMNGGTVFYCFPKEPLFSLSNSLLAFIGLVSYDPQMHIVKEPNFGV